MAAKAAPISAARSGGFIKYSMVWAWIVEPDDEPTDELLQPTRLLFGSGLVAIRDHFRKKIVARLEAVVPIPVPAPGDGGEHLLIERARQG